MLNYAIYYHKFEESTWIRNFQGARAREKLTKAHARAQNLTESSVLSTGDSHQALVTGPRAEVWKIPQIGLPFVRNVRTLG